MAEIPSLPFAPEKRAKVDGSKKFEVMAQMPDLFKQAFSGQLRPQKSEVIHFGNLRIQHPDNGLITVDGVKALLSDGASALTRASNTGDELSFIFEAPSYKRLAEVMSTVIGILKPFEKSAGLDLAELVKQYEGIQVKAGQEA
jgi:phosphomannomutase